MDSAGRIERFQKKYSKVTKKKAAPAEETQS
jgi:ribosomal protein L31